MRSLLLGSLALLAGALTACGPSDYWQGTFQESGCKGRWVTTSQLRTAVDTVRVVVVCQGSK
jgi:hypothetical protein